MRKSLLTLSFLAVFSTVAARHAQAVEVDFWVGVDDYAALYVDGELLGVYDAVPAGEIRVVKDLSPGWHDVRLVYQNRYGSNFIWFARKHPDDAVHREYFKDELRSLNSNGELISGLHCEYDGINVYGQATQFAVEGEGPIYHGYPDRYEGVRGQLWAGEFDGWSLFTEVMTGQILVPGPAAVAIDIDIKPESADNPINLQSKGKIPVAVLSSVDFDAMLLDENSVRLNGAAIALTRAGNFMTSVEDVNDDGLSDLVCHFLTQQLDIDQLTQGIGLLQGTLFDGTLVEGMDIVTVVP